MINRKRVAAAIAVVLLLAAGVSWLVSRPHTDGTKPSASTSKAPSPQAPATTPPPAAFDKNQFSKDTPDSPWLVVDKHRPLSPKDYAPALATPNVPLRLNASTPEMQLSAAIVPAVEALFGAAKQEGLPLMVASGYRSYQEQITVYNNEVKNYGQQTADRESARPGFSEHQTGMALDVEPASRQCEVAACFGDLPEGKWLAANAYKYGFVIRYTQGSEAVTGYTYEPWHIRYVGKPLANELHQQGNPPLETFFSLGAAPDYQ
jgi:D-alanyl-D-alanine carboxypeptidase